MAEGSRGIPTGPTIRDQAKANKGKRTAGGGEDKEVVKAALASPLTVPWPNLPRHLQRTLLHALPQIVPSEVADYHVSRQRCHRTKKRGRAKDALKAVKAVTDNVGGIGDGLAEDAAESSKANGKRPASPIETGPSKKLKLAIPPIQSPSTDRPVPPEILQHLVLGINEVLKSLERQISDLRMRIMQMGDALNGQLRKPPLLPLPSSSSGLLPTAPSEIDLRSSDPTPTATSARGPVKPAKAPPIMWIFIPLASINPQTLVQPIPQYCATYNTLVFQYIHLAKICRSRLPSARIDEVIGEEPEEVRVVPMARVEAEMAEMVGLRRLAALGVRASHPAIKILHGLLPKSVLHPPRLSLTLPLPTSALHIYNGVASTKPAAPPPPPVTDKPRHSPPIKKPAAASGAFIHYAPLHVKGITTTVPADGNARKAQRMEEVRARRREVKEKKRLGKVGKKEARKAREAVGAGITA